MVLEILNKIPIKAQQPWTCKGELDQQLNRQSTFKTFTKCIKQIHIQQMINILPLITFRWEVPLRHNNKMHLAQIQPALGSMLLGAITHQQLQAKNHSCQWWDKWTTCQWQTKICKANRIKWDRSEANKMDMVWTTGCNNSNLEALELSHNKWTNLAMVSISSHNLQEMGVSNKHSNHLFQACKIQVSVSLNNKLPLVLEILNQRHLKSQETPFKMG